ncbi:MAG: S1C family serine protease [Acidimicrobiales bacterium]
MHPDDDGEEDAPSFGPPLPPDDRLWRHPSELTLAATSPQARRAAAPANGPRVLGIAVVSGLLGAVLTVGVVAVTVGLGTQTERPGVEKVASGSLNASLVSQSVPADSGAVVAKKLRASVVRIAAGTARVIGSAVVLRDDGYLLTEAGLLAGATTATVTIEGEELAATVLGTDPLTDVAVLRVARQLTPATLDDGRGPAMGERSFIAAAKAVGEPAMTAGVISALDRKVTAADGTVLHGMVQTDAPIDATALGGALTDEHGVVVALVTGPPSSTGGYAVPIATAVSIADDIVANGHARHVWLGVEGADLDASSASSLAIAGGASITKVANGSPAAAAGLQDGDVITAVGTSPVTSMSDLVVGLRAHNPGETIDLEYWRGTEMHHCTATLAERA